LRNAPTQTRQTTSEGVTSHSTLSCTISRTHTLRVLSRLCCNSLLLTHQHPLSTPLLSVTLPSRVHPSTALLKTEIVRAVKRASVRGPLPPGPKMKQIATSPREVGHGIGPRTESLLSTLQETIMMAMCFIFGLVLP